MNPLRALTLDDLRRRTSIKWRLHGPDVVPMFVAEMDVPLAEPVARALAEAVALGDTGYPADGYADAYASFAADAWGWEVVTSRSVEVADVMTGVREAIRLTTEPGDVVVVNPPVYPPFFEAVQHEGREVLEVPLGADGRLDLDLLASVVELTRPAAYLLCSPHNPTAVIHTADELAQVASLAASSGMRVVVDEIHAPLADPAAFVPYLSVAGTDDAYAVVSASKAFNLAGAKAALLVGGAATGVEVSSVPELVRHGPTHLGTIAHVAALTEGREWLADLRAGIAENRTLLTSLVAEYLPDAVLTTGPGTYTAWLDLRAYDVGADPAAVVLERGRVALASGLPFAPGSGVGEGRARLTYATPPEVLEEAVRRVASALVH